MKLPLYITFGVFLGCTALPVPPETDTGTATESPTEEQPDCSVCEDIAFECDKGECTYPTNEECFLGAGYWCECLPTSCTDDELLSNYLLCVSGVAEADILLCYGAFAGDCQAAYEVCVP